PRKTTPKPPLTIVCRLRTHILKIDLPHRLLHHELDDAIERADLTADLLDHPINACTDVRASKRLLARRVALVVRVWVLHWDNKLNVGAIAELDQQTRGFVAAKLALGKAFSWSLPRYPGSTKPLPKEPA
ncbi:hypothetical protein, partial [Crossiella equi]